MPGDHVLINDTLYPAAEAKISVFDIGFMRGVGAFETLRTYAGGLPHALSDHSQRLWRSAEELGIPQLKTDKALRTDIARLYEVCGYDELRLNFMISPGVHTGGVFNSAEPTWVIIAKELIPAPEEDYEHGVKAICFDGQRILPHLKTTNYLTGRRGIQLATEAGAQEAFYVNEQGLVTEGVTSNILVFKNGCIHEVASDRLSGITMAGIERLAKTLGIEWKKTELSKEALFAADECWITSSVRQLLPIVNIDGQDIADGKVGPMARQLRTAYMQMCLEEVRADAAAAQ